MFVPHCPHSRHFPLVKREKEFLATMRKTSSDRFGCIGRLYRAGEYHRPYFWEWALSQMCCNLVFSRRSKIFGSSIAFPLFGLQLRSEPPGYFLLFFCRSQLPHTSCFIFLCLPHGPIPFCARPFLWRGIRPHACRLCEAQVVLGDGIKSRIIPIQVNTLQLQDPLQTLTKIPTSVCLVDGILKCPGLRAVG